jgi:hypothetical protein
MSDEKNKELEIKVYQCPNCGLTAQVAKWIEVDPKRYMELGMVPPEDALKEEIIQLKAIVADYEAQFKSSDNLKAKINNLHKVIAKQQLKIEHQRENIGTLLQLYTSGKRSKAHKKLREKYRVLKARMDAA